MGVIGAAAAQGGQGRRLLAALLLAYAMALQSMLVAWAGARIDPASPHAVFCFAQGAEDGHAGAPVSPGAGHDHCFTGPCHMGWSPVAVVPGSGASGLLPPAIAGLAAPTRAGSAEAPTFPPAAPGAPRAPPASVRPA